MEQDGNEYEGDDVITDGATGMGTLEEETGADDLSDDMSDTGWDTDLELEGAYTVSLEVGGIMTPPASAQYHNKIKSQIKRVMTLTMTSDIG